MSESGPHRNLTGSLDRSATGCRRWNGRAGDVTGMGTLVEVRVGLADIREILNAHHLSHGANHFSILSNYNILRPYKTQQYLHVII